MTTKLIGQLKKITGESAFPFISAGVTVDENVSGHVVSEDALTALIEAAIAGDAAIASVADQALQVQQAVAAQQAAEASLATANATIATNATRNAELEARVAELEADGSVTNTSRANDAGGKIKVAFHESAENPMNKIADSLLGAPKLKAEE